LAILNRIVGPSDRGRLSGADRSVANLAGLIAPAVFAALFAAVTGYGADSWLVGAPLFVGAAFVIVGTVVTIASLNRTVSVRPLLAASPP
jgi:DHA1 family tetracycline resistance protein-like MFS transporter